MPTSCAGRPGWRHCSSWPSRPVPDLPGPVLDLPAVAVPAPELPAVAAPVHDLPAVVDTAVGRRPAEVVQPVLVHAGLLDRLDEEQRAAASVTSGPLLVVAGPGTGKTRTLTHRIAHLVAEHGVAPGRCLAITFTRRAATELAERLAVLVPGHAAAIAVTTFHGLGARILRELYARVGLSAAFRVADEGDRLAVLQEVTGSAGAARRMLPQLARARRLGAVPDGLGDLRDLHSFPPR